MREREITDKIKIYPELEKDGQKIIPVSVFVRLDFSGEDHLEKQNVEAAE